MNKKIALTLILIGALSMASASCTKTPDTSASTASAAEASAESTEDTSVTTTTMPTDTSETESSGEDQASYEMPEQYKKIILDYCKAADNGEMWDATMYVGVFAKKDDTADVYGEKLTRDQIPVSIEDVSAVLEPEMLENIGFALRDLDGDGVPELIVSSTYSGFKEEPFFEIGSLYSINSEGKAYKLLGSWSRCTGYLGVDNTIMLSAQSSHSLLGEQEYGRYRLEGEELVFVDEIYTTAEQYFYIPDETTKNNFDMTINRLDPASHYTGGIFDSLLCDKSRYDEFVKPFGEDQGITLTTFAAYQRDGSQ